MKKRKIQKKKITIEEALKKIYLIKSNRISIPDCLIGKNIRLVLSFEMDNKIRDYDEINSLNKEINFLKAQNKELYDILEKARKKSRRVKNG
jgi:hypothetical protein